MSFQSGVKFTARISYKRNPSGRGWWSEFGIAGILRLVSSCLKLSSCLKPRRGKTTPRRGRSSMAELLPLLGLLMAVKKRKDHTEKRKELDG